MTLFVISRDRNTIYEIDDIYVMIAVFLVTYYLTLYTKKIIQKIRSHLKQKKIISNIIKKQGGQSIDLDPINWKEFDTIINECLKNDKAYSLLDTRIKKAIRFFLRLNVQENIILTPNLIRLITKAFIRKDRPSVVNVSNLLFVANNTRKVLTRVIGAILAGLAGAIMGGLYYGVVLVSLTYLFTPNDINCEQYLKEISSDAIHKEIPIFTTKDEDHCISSSMPEKVQIYIPEGKKVVVTDPKLETKEIRQTYKKSPKPAKQVNFSDFKRNDPILSKFNVKEEDVTNTESNSFNLKLTRKEIIEAIDKGLD